MSNDLALMTEWLDRNNPPDSVVSFAKRLANIASLDASGINTSVLDIMHGILTAEGEEAVFEAANAGTLGGKSFREPFRLASDGIEWKQSAAMFREQGGFPFYALQRITKLDSGESAVLTCGGFTYITTLWALWEQDILNKYDADGGMPLIIEARTAASGFDFLMLTKYVVPDSVPKKPAKSK